MSERGELKGSVLLERSRRISVVTKSPGGVRRGRRSDREVAETGAVQRSRTSREVKVESTGKETPRRDVRVGPNSWGSVFRHVGTRRKRLCK